jgi:hypothetical protein
MDRQSATASLLVAEITELTVRSRDGDKLGHIKSFVVNKTSGQSVYAILSLGGFLGINRSYYPVPFSLIAYDRSQDEYVITMDRRVLEGGPSWSNNPPEFDHAYVDRVSGYYDRETGM